MGVWWLAQATSSRRRRLHSVPHSCHACPAASQKHEHSARQSKSKSRPHLCSVSLTPQQQPAIPPLLQSSTLHFTVTTSESLPFHLQSRVAKDPVLFSSICAPQYHTEPPPACHLHFPSPPAIHRALFAFHMPLTKGGPSPGRNSPAHAGKSSHFRHPFGGRVSKHFGDMVSTLAAPHCPSELTPGSCLPRMPICLTTTSA